jgi:PAS domain S-box-containing protein
MNPNNKTNDLEKLKSRIKSLEQETVALQSEKEVYQAALQQNLNVMRNLFDDTGFGMLLVDFDGSIVRSNDLFNNLTGYSSKEVLSMSFYQFFQPQQNDYSEYPQFLLTDSGKNYFKKIYKKNGSTAYVKINATISHDLHKKPKSIFVMVEDVTEKTKMEKIKSSLYKISKATNNTHDVNELLKRIKHTLNIIFEDSKLFIALSDEMNEQLHLPYSEESSDVDSNWLHHPLSHQVYSTGNSKLLKKPELELLLKKESAEIPCAWMAVPLMVDGKSIGVLAIENFEHEDVFSKNDLDTFEFISTHVAMAIERKTSEQKIKIEKAYFENLFQNSPEAIVIINQNGHIHSINDEFTKLFGYSWDEAKEKNISMLLPQDSFRSESEIFRKNTFDNKKQLIETSRRRKNGEVIEVSILSSPINVDEKTQLAYIIYRDISERKEAERKLAVAKEKAEESDRLKSAFLANLSHEIRTPLNAIVGFSSLLSSERVDNTEQRVKYVEHISSSSDNLVKLIDNIIDVSKIESGQVEIRKDEFPLRSVLDEQYNLFYQRYMKHGQTHVTFEKDYDFINGLDVISDVTRLQQVISIVLDNAFKFTPKGKIIIGCKLCGSYVSVFVKDEGIGIANHDLDKIFHRFVKIDDDKSKLFRGTGIGLFIAKNVMNYMDGDIRVESETGRGSTFYIDLPVSQPPVTITPEPATCSTKVLDGKHILVVEDTPSNYIFIEAVLMDTGANLVWAKTGKEALHFAETQHFDIILMDIALPDISGYEVTRAILRSQPSIPIIAQTAFASASEKDKCLEAGCIDYLAKPIREKQLIDCVVKTVT